jgi:hypothetical protein
MKLAFALLMCFSLHLSDITGEIAAAFRQGNARDLAKHFGNNIDLTVGEKQEMYSKAQAEQVLRGFFLKNPPRSFILKSKSTGNTATPYGIGTYTSTGAQHFRVYFMIKKIGNQSFIQQLSIENES